MSAAVLGITVLVLNALTIGSLMLTVFVLKLTDYVELTKVQLVLAVTVVMI